VPASINISTAAWFLILTALLSSVFQTIMIITGSIAGGGTHYIAGVMWAPAVAAVLTVYIKGLRADSLALGWGGARYAWGAYSTPLAYATVAYSVTWLLGLGSFPSPEGIARLNTRLGWHLSDATFVPVYFVLIATTGMVGNVARALGEEIGWRGLLWSQWFPSMGFTKASLLIGLVWSASHVPGIVLADYTSGAPWWFTLPCFFVMVTAASVILCWFRLKSNSVWPCAILHASHNLFIQSFFTPLTGDRGGVTKYVIGEFGVALPIVVTLLAILFWLRRGDVESHTRIAA